jgi:predicted O-methyltransferase YrrM
VAGMTPSVARHMKPKRKLGQQLRDLADFRNHWRIKRLAERWRNLPSHFLQIVYGLPSITLRELVPGSVTPAEPILDDLCLPNHYEGPGHNDLLPLLAILAARQPKVVLELGTAHGNTTANICRQCPGAKVYSVNALPEQISGDLITFALSRDEIGRAFRLHGFGDRVTQIYANTLQLDLSPHVAPRTVDFAIIDACHDTPFVVNDFHQVKPYMKPGGLVLLHDTHPSMEEHLVGSYRACMLLRKQGYDLRHLEGTWWGVWQAT